MNCIVERYDEFQGYSYKCAFCGKKSFNIKDIMHKQTCIVENKKNKFRMNFSNDTKRLIQDLIRYCLNIFKEQDEEYLDFDYSTLNGVKWFDSGSSGRLILGLGKTNHKGSFHLQTQTPIILKIDPRIRLNEQYGYMGSNFGAINNWCKAVETDTTSLFAQLYDCALDGTWMIMEECIPIYDTLTPKIQERDGLFDYNGEKYIDSFLEKLNENNWFGPDYRHGNIGLDSDNNVVLLDYETAPKYKIS